MTLRNQITKTKTVREALLLLADAIDELSTTDPMDEPVDWLTTDEIKERYDDVLEKHGLQPLQDNRAEIQGDDVVVPPADEERQQRRRALADSMQLWEFIPLAREDAIEQYAKGGPLWLYYGNRDVVMQQPMIVRQAMVADVAHDSHTEAEEMGRDVLKQTDSVPWQNQVDAIQRMVDHG